ncbi:MAG: hypothetical protein M1829_005144 [Trizodia sp. TS-e1964]|nr:MAG: hypothetical protein M1829_005144 [Trizodia sp. TS-e1964]
MEEYTARSIKGLLEDLKGKLAFITSEAQRLQEANRASSKTTDSEPESNEKGNLSAVDFTIDPISRACQTSQDTLSRITTLITRSPSFLNLKDTTTSERDFTTPGKPGELSCPYAALDPTRPPASISSRLYRSRTRRTNSISTSHRRKVSQPITDPISAEMNHEGLFSPPPSGSANGSAYKCPIRFLDQHSPEEVAQYFENHKHEVPRSHEVCVRRYQSNAASIRELDAKYGNLVSMIQGLGQKHKSMLPADEDIATQETPPLSNEQVEMWAKGIDADLKELETAVKSHDDLANDERENHFERPMKEVRVGESPSRPWGIFVPTVTTPAPQSTEQAVPHPAPNSSPQVPASAVPGRCPFSNQGNKILPKDHLSPPGVHFQNNAAFIPSPAAITTSDLNLAQSSTPNLIFTGPVFVGYPLEQAMALAQQWKAEAPASKGTQLDG